MSHERPELEQWLRKSGNSPRHIERILKKLDRFDDQITRESLFDDLATGAFDIRSIIEEALKEDVIPPELHREEDVFLQGAFVV